MTLAPQRPRQKCQPCVSVQIYLESENRKSEGNI